MALLFKFVRFCYKSQIHCWFIFSHLWSFSYHRLSSLNRCACNCQNECWWNFPLSYRVRILPSARCSFNHEDCRCSICPAPWDRVRISTLHPLLQDYLSLPWQFCASHTALILARNLGNDTLLLPTDTMMPFI